jgi:hypothetical protein
MAVFTLQPGILALTHDSTIENLFRRAFDGHAVIAQRRFQFRGPQPRGAGGSRIGMVLHGRCQRLIPSQTLKGRTKNNSSPRVASELTLPQVFGAATPALMISAVEYVGRVVLFSNGLQSL